MTTLTAYFKKLLLKYLSQYTGIILVTPQAAKRTCVCPFVFQFWTPLIPVAFPITCIPRRAPARRLDGSENVGILFFSPPMNAPQVKHDRMLPGMEQEMFNRDIEISTHSQGAALQLTFTSSLYHTSHREPQHRDNMGIHIRSGNTHRMMEVSEVAGSAHAVAFLLHLAG